MEIIFGLIICLAFCYVHKGSEIIWDTYRNNIPIVLKCKYFHAYILLCFIFSSILYIAIYINPYLSETIFKKGIHKYLLPLYSVISIKLILKATPFSTANNDLNLSLLLKRINRFFDKNINDDFDIYKSRILDEHERHYYNVQEHDMIETFSNILPTKLDDEDKKKYKKSFKSQLSKREKLDYLLMTFGQRRLDFYTQRTLKKKR